MVKQLKDFGGKGFGDDGNKRRMAKKLGDENVFWRIPSSKQPEIKTTWEKQQKRIGEVIGFDSEGELPAVNNNTLTVYGQYLEKNLELPCYLTGSEDFSWEEAFVFGYMSQKQHDELRKKRASYLDTYKLIHLITDFKMWSEIGVAVQRMEDGKKFELSLSELKATDNLCKNYQLLDDYSSWFWNYR